VVPSRRPTKVAAAVLALLTAYGAGAATVAATSSSSSGAPSVLDQAERRIAAQAAVPVTSTQLERAAVEGMLASLDDKWSTYYDPADFARFEQVLAGGYTGVGVWVRRAADGSLRLSSVQTGSPSARAGLRVGDVLIAVGGKAVVGLSVADAVSLLRGPAGSAVAIVVRRGITLFDVTVSRTMLSDDDVYADMLTPTVERLRVAAFTRGVGRWVRSEVAEAKARHLTGLVLDLRDNPGGLLDEAVETASAFLDGGVVISYVQRGRAPQVLDALGHGELGTPLVVLVDGGTASAAEIVAAALQDRGRAVLMGSRTFGKGTVQAPTQLPDGSGMEFTVGHYVTPDGQSLEGVGVEPDVLLPVGTPSDVVVARVVTVLSGLTADAGSTGRG
jgi:carboxyl-terminal processing protease